VRRRAVLLAALAIGGCDANLGVRGVLNLDKVTTRIARVTRRHAAVAAKIMCPDQVQLRKGAVFSCAARFPVGRVRIKVVQTDDKGHVRYEYPKYTMLDVPSVAVHIEHRLAHDEHMRVLVVCPQPVLERIGENFTCVSTAQDGVEHRIVVKQTGAKTGPAFVVK
jgi:hypothetical protein